MIFEALQGGKNLRRKYLLAKSLRQVASDLGGIGIFAKLGHGAQRDVLEHPQRGAGSGWRRGSRVHPFFFLLARNVELPGDNVIARG